MSSQPLSARLRFPQALGSMRRLGQWLRARSAAQQQAALQNATTARRVASRRADFLAETDRSHGDSSATLITTHSHDHKRDATEANRSNWEMASGLSPNSASGVHAESSGPAENMPDTLIDKDPIPYEILFTAHPKHKQRDHPSVHSIFPSANPSARQHRIASSPPPPPLPKPTSPLTQKWEMSKHEVEAGIQAEAENSVVGSASGIRLDSDPVSHQKPHHRRYSSPVAISAPAVVSSLQSDMERKKIKVAETRQNRANLQVNDLQRQSSMVSDSALIKEVIVRLDSLDEAVRVKSVALRGSSFSQRGSDNWTERMKEPAGMHTPSEFGSPLLDTRLSIPHPILFEMTLHNSLPTVESPLMTPITSAVLAAQSSLAQSKFPVSESLLINSRPHTRPYQEFILTHHSRWQSPNPNRHSSSSIHSHLRIAHSRQRSVPVRPTHLSNLANPPLGVGKILGDDDVNFFHDSRIDLSTRTISNSSHSKAILTLSPLPSEASPTTGLHFYDRPRRQPDVPLFPRPPMLK
jgi:hypothetical protein